MIGAATVTIPPMVNPPTLPTPPVTVTTPVAITNPIANYPIPAPCPVNTVFMDGVM